MEKIYIEAASGISGDMTVAALLDLGASQEVLMKALDSIRPKEFEIKISRVKKSGLECADFDVILDDDNHDHDMEYLYGHKHGDEENYDHEHCHNHEHTHEQNDNHEYYENQNSTNIGDNLRDHQHSENAEHTHHNHQNCENAEHTHHHSHRTMAQVNEILDTVDMTPTARRITDRIFEIIAEAESKAHGVPVSEVHFHEVGAMDSIVDIVAAAVCLDNLGVKEVIVPRLYDGQGTVRCQHGILPVPVPAVTNIVSAHSIPMEILKTQGELVTPTGAAIVAAVATSKELPKEFVIKKVGLGAGKRQTGLAGFLRIMEVE